MQATFSRPVVVDTTGGTPSLKIGLGAGAGGGQRTASYVGGSGTNKLVFEYEVAEADRSTDGVKVVNDSLVLNNGTMTSTDGLNALLGLTGPTHSTDHLVDGSMSEEVEAEVLVSKHRRSDDYQPLAGLEQQRFGAAVPHRLARHRLRPHQRRGGDGRHISLQHECEAHDGAADGREPRRCRGREVDQSVAADAGGK